MKLDPNKVTHIAIHTAATPERSIDISAASIRRYHIETKGWSDIGYHYVVRFDGSITCGSVYLNCPWGNEIQA